MPDRKQQRSKGHGDKEQSGGKKLGFLGSRHGTGHLLLGKKGIQDAQTNSVPKKGTPLEDFGSTQKKRGEREKIKREHSTIQTKGGTVGSPGKAERRPRTQNPVPRGNPRERE